MTKIQQDFLDVRKHGFFRVAAVTPRVHLANPKKNTQEILGWFSKLDEDGVQMAVFPELCMSGYSVQDLHHQSPLIKSTLKGLKKLVEQSLKYPDMIFVVGAAIVVRGGLYNVGVVIQNGQI